MSYLTTELLTSLLQGGAAANEFLRSKIEEGVNAVLKAELAGFLSYEKHSSAGWHTGNSRNGSYQRSIVTTYGKITVDVPRQQTSPRLQLTSRIILTRFTADRLPSDMPSSFVMPYMSISAATAWPRRLSTSCSALHRKDTRKFSTMLFYCLNQRELRRHA